MYIRSEYKNVNFAQKIYNGMPKKYTGKGISNGIAFGSNVFLRAIPFQIPTCAIAYFAQKIRFKHKSPHLGKSVTTPE